MTPTAATLLQTFVAMSVLYVWVVRYPAVLADFTAFGLPDWLRDLTGAAKLTGAALLLGVGDNLEAIGAGIIAAFMAAALVMHLKVKNPLAKMVPSLGLGAGAVLVLLYRLGES